MATMMCNGIIQMEIWMRVALAMLVMASTLRTTESLSTKAPNNLKYRPAKSSDIPQIATLLTTTFEDIASWNFIERKISNDKYTSMLDQRMIQLVNVGARHSLIVTVDPASSDDVVGFMELGILPSPVPIPTGNGEEGRPEMPYLANVAVSNDYRRRGIGSTLVKLAMKIGKKWCDEDLVQCEESISASESIWTTAAATATDLDDDGAVEIGDAATSSACLFLAVEKDNMAAVQMYERLDFVRIIDETAKLSKAAQKKLRRPPRLYFQKDLNVEDKKKS